MHERTVQIAVGGEVPEHVHDLGVEDGRDFEVFAGGGGAGEDEDARADDGADSERGERPGAESFLQLVTGFGGLGDKPVDRLTGKKLIRQRIAPAPRLTKSKPWRCEWNDPEQMITSKTATTYGQLRKRRAEVGVADSAIIREKEPANGTNPTKTGRDGRRRLNPGYGTKSNVKSKVNYPTSANCGRSGAPVSLQLYLWWKRLSAWRFRGLLS